jgi:predicted dehydrogenase
MRGVILVGAGRWGHIHAQKWTAVSARPLSAVVDLYLKRAQALSEQYGGIPLGSIEDFRGDLKGRLVVVVTPVESMLSLGRWVASRGGDLFLEKPGSTNADALLSLTRLCEVAQRKLVVGYIERFNPIVEHQIFPLFKDLIQGLIEAQTAESLRERDPISLVIYRSTTSEGGDLPLDLMCHDLDLLLWFFDRLELSIVKISKRFTRLTSSVPSDESYIQSLDTTRLNCVFHLSPLDTSTSSISLSVEVNASRGAQQRAWVFEGVRYDLDQHEADPLYQQCICFWNWRLHSKRDHRLCSGERASQVLSLLTP